MDGIFDVFVKFMSVALKFLGLLFKGARAIGITPLLVVFLIQLTGVKFSELIVYYVIALIWSCANIYTKIMRRANPDFKFWGSLFAAITGHSVKGKGIQSKTKGVKNKTMQDQMGADSFIFYGKDKSGYVVQNANEDGHLLVIGGAGSGKSTCIAQTSINTWKNHHIWCIDIKGALFDKSPNRCGSVQLLLGNPDGARYDAFYAVRNSDNKPNAVKTIANALIQSKSPNGADAHWVESAQNFLIGSLLYCYNDKKMEFAKALKYIQKQGKDLIEEALKNTSDEAVQMYFSPFASMGDKELGSVLSTLSTTLLSIVTDKDLINSLDITTAKSSILTPETIEHNDVYIIAQEHQLENYKNVLTLIVNQQLKQFEQRPDNNDKPILCLLDEFPRLGNLENIKNGLATLRSKKVHLALFIQSLAQLDDLYGKSIRQGICDNCATKVVLRCSEPESQKYISTLVGTYDKARNSVTSQNMGGGSTSVSYQDTLIIKPEKLGYFDDEFLYLDKTGYKMLQKVPYYSKEFQEQFRGNAA